MRRLALAALLLCPLVSAGDLPGVVAPAVRLPGTSAFAVSRLFVVDLNQDGLPDYLTSATDGDLRLVTALALGGGSHAPVIEQLISADSEGDACVAADFDGDGFPDTIAHVYEPASVLQVLLGVGDGSFVAAGTVTTSEPDAPDATLDANLDGALDLLCDGPTLLLLLGDGAGGFTESAALTPSSAPGSPLRLRTGDLDLDGDVEVITGNSTTPLSTLHFTSAAGGSLVAMPDLTVPFPVSDLAIGQVVGSAFPDIVLASDAAFTANVVVRNFGGSSFVPQPGLADDTGWDRVQLVDVGGDGLLDLVGASLLDSVNTVRVRAGEVGGSFAPAIVVPMLELEEISTADMDLDGLADVIASVNVSGDSDRLLLRGESPNRLAFHGTVPSWLGAGNLVPGDFNADGKRDLALLLPNTEQVAVQAGDGAGGLSSPSFTMLQPADSPRAGVVLDFDADGDEDLAVTGAPSGSATIYRNTGAPAPVLSQTLVVGVSEITAGELNGDAWLDLVTPSSGVGSPPGDSKGLWLSFGQATGVFTAPVNAASTETIYHHTLGDFDSDGDLDVAIGGQPQVIRSLLNNGSGAFAAGPSTPFITGFATSLATEDMDEDGVQDLVAGIEGLGVFVYSDFGPTGFTQGAGSPLASAPVRIADLDLDGHADVIAQEGSSSLQALRGDGLGNLQPLWRTDVSWPIAGFAALQLAGDVGPDVLVSTLHPSVFELTDVRQTGPAAWTAMPAGKPGVAGVPVLLGTGTLAAGSPVSLNVSHAAPLAPLTLVIGLSRVDLPFKGGLLVPSPDLLISGLVTNGSGALTLPATWPAGLPSGLSIWLQAWITDAAATKNLSATTSLRAFTP